MHIGISSFLPRWCPDSDSLTPPLQWRMPAALAVTDMIIEWLCQNPISLMPARCLLLMKLTVIESGLNKTDWGRIQNTKSCSWSSVSACSGLSLSLKPSLGHFPSLWLFPLSATLFPQPLVQISPLYPPVSVQCLFLRTYSSPTFLVPFSACIFHLQHLFILVFEFAPFSLSPQTVIFMRAGTMSILHITVSLTPSTMPGRKKAFKTNIWCIHE